MRRRSILNAIAAGALLALGSAGGQPHLFAGDLRVVPLFDGERDDGGTLRNTWGGTFSNGNVVSFGHQTSVVHSGVGAYQANLGSVLNDGFRFFQTFSSQTTGAQAARQDRDLTRFQTLQGYVRNDTNARLTFSLEVKDYRDQGAHQAKRSYSLDPGAWTKIEAPLDFSTGWNVTGSPDFTRTYALGFLVDADFGDASGSLYLDDFQLVEKGPPIDPATAPIDVVAEHLAQRQFMGLWTARNKTSGLVPNRPDDVSDAALNTTTGVVWNLPRAIRSGWVSQADADAYMGLLVSSLNTNRSQSNFLPTRFLNLVSASPVGSRQESTIDASFLALALHNYRAQAATPAALAQSIATLENRFAWNEFDGPGAYGHGYESGSMIPFTYAGYTNENKTIALAGELSTAYHVPLETMWNKDVGRTLVHLVDPQHNFLVYSYSDEYRASFGQALVNLFADVSDRGVDTYPQRSLARNPWVNFVRHEGEVSDFLQNANRPNFLQPDAADGAAGYKQYSLFNDFDQPNLFMPWSVAFALLAGADGAEDALRFLLDNGLGGGLDGPLGMTDSAQWNPANTNPTDVPSFADNWNMTMSTIALLEFVDRYRNQPSASQLFAALPEVKSALDEVFIDGDLNGNGVTNSQDLSLWKNGFGIAFNATPNTGDADGDGDVDGADFLRWQRGVSAASSTSAPEPASGALAAIALGALAGRTTRLRRRC